jgi:hypothetical protein
MGLRLQLVACEDELHRHPHVKNFSSKVNNGAGYFQKRVASLKFKMRFTGVVLTISNLTSLTETPAREFNQSR